MLISARQIEAVTQAKLAIAEAKEPLLIGELGVLLLPFARGSESHLLLSQTL